MNRKLIFALLIALVLLSSCQKSQESEAVEAQDQEIELIYSTVEATPVSTGAITDYHNFSGSVTAKDSVAIIPEASGKISQLLIEEGSLVKKDDIVAYIDPSRPGQSYLPSPVKATMNGTVTTLTGAVGQWAGPTSAIAVVSTLDNLEIRFSVIERYVSLVKEGQKALITFDAFPGEVFEATVTKLSPTLDTNTRTRSATCRLDKEDERVIAGMYARIKLVVAEKDGVIVVPFAAVSTTENGSYVYVVGNEGSEKVARRKSVSIGTRQDDRIEITDGLKEGDLLITKGQGLVSDGSYLNVISR